MYQSGLIQKCQSCQELLSEYSHECSTQTTELVLLDELIQVDTQKLEDETEMLAVDKGVSQAQKMMIIVLVELTVDQIEDRHFHHTLVEVCGPILDNFHSHDFLCLQVLAFHDLTESALTQDIQDEISILMACLLRTQYVVDIEDVVTVVIVETIILRAFARLSEDSARVS